MLALLDITVQRRTPKKEFDAFQLLSGDISLLQLMLPDSKLVSTFVFGNKASVSIREITEFRNELLALSESSLPADEVQRSIFAGFTGTTNAVELRERLLESIDECLVDITGVVPLRG